LENVHFFPDEWQPLVYERPFSSLNPENDVPVSVPQTDENIQNEEKEEEEEEEDSLSSHSSSSDQEVDEDEEHEEQEKYDDDEEMSMSSSESDGDEHLEKANIIVSSQGGEGAADAVKPGGEKDGGLEKVGLRTSQRIQNRLRNIRLDRRLTLPFRVDASSGVTLCKKRFNCDGYQSDVVDKHACQDDVIGFTAFLKGCRNGHIEHELANNGWWRQKFENDVILIKGGLGQSSPIAQANFKAVTDWALLGHGYWTKPYVSNHRCKDGSVYKTPGGKKEKCAFCNCLRNCTTLLHVGGKEYPLGHIKCENVARATVKFYTYLRKCIEDRARGHLHVQGLHARFEDIKNAKSIKAGNKITGKRLNKEKI
jgi:hypothetical protein